METHCSDHINFATKVGNIEFMLTEIRDKICCHITQGEEKGGFRDRLIVVEQEVAALRKSVWKIGMAAGFMGALIGNIAPEVISLFVKFLVGH